MASKSRRHWRTFTRAIWFTATSSPKISACAPTPTKAPRRFCSTLASPRRATARPAMLTARARSGTRRAAAPSATRPKRPQNAAVPTPAADIHAWGMTWYHLLTGLDPTDPEQLRRMKIHAPRGFNSQISPGWDALISACIAPNPDDRPQNGAALLERLQELSAPPTAKPTVVLVATAKSVPKSAPAPVQAQQATPNSTPGVTPLVFRSGHAASTVGEMVWLLDAYEREGASRLYSGEIEGWLQRHGETELARRAAQIRQQYVGRPQQGLETFIAATGLLARPQLQLGAAQLDFGTLRPDGRKTVDLSVQNGGRGHLFGTISANLGALSTPGGWDGNRARVPVTFDANRLAPGHYQGEIELDSLAGVQRIPFVARVAGPSFWPAFLTVVLCGVLGGISGALLRVVPLMYTPHPTWFVGTEPKWWPVSPLLAATFWGCLMVWTILEATRKRSCALVVTVGILGTLAAFFAGLAGNSVLAQADASLHSIVGARLGEFAAGAWLTAGASLGAAWGAVRRVGDWFTIRALAVILGLGATAGLVWLALTGAGF